MDEGNTFVNALFGAVVTVVASGFLPFGPVVGGGVAGYLQGGTRSDGLRVGALSGVIAAIPFVVVLLVALSFFGIVSFGGMDGLALGIVGSGIAIVVFVVAVGTSVGFSALGGWLGNYVKYETDFEI